MDFGRFSVHRSINKFFWDCQRLWDVYSQSGLQSEPQSSGIEWLILEICMKVWFLLGLLTISLSMNFFETAEGYGMFLFN